MRCLIRNVQALFALLMLGGCINALAEPYTPPIGSPERVAIANAVRASLAQLGGLRTMPAGVRNSLLEHSRLRAITRFLKGEDRKSTVEWLMGPSISSHFLEREVPAGKCSTCKRAAMSRTVPRLSSFAQACLQTIL